MKTKAWDKDIEESIRHRTVKDVLDEYRDRQATKLSIVDEEIEQHMYNLWSLSGGKIGKKPPEGEEGI